MSESGATAKRGKTFVQVLVIEDELVARRATTQGLREEGFRVMEAADGLAGLELATRETPDVVILDLRLPRLDGEHVLEKLRQSSDVPVIVVSAKRNEEDRIEVLNLGADDYIVKPFSVRELVARIRAVLRRAAGEVTSAVTVGDVTIDFPSRTATRAAARIPLTAQEFAVIACLARRRGRLVSRELLEEVIQRGRTTDAGPQPGTTTVSNIVDVIVLRLRKKLGQDLITTRRGQGFIIDG
jgi:two-component system, OmpR family, response regulator